MYKKGNNCNKMDSNINKLKIIKTKSVDKCGGIYYNENNKRTENKRFQGTVDNQFTSNKIQAKEVRTAKDLILFHL